MDSHTAQSQGEHLMACLFSSVAHSNICKCKPSHFTDLSMTRGLNQQPVMFNYAECFQ